MKGKGERNQMRGNQLARIAVYAIGFAMVFPFCFVREARAFDRPDLLTRQIKATAIKGETIDQVIGHLTEYGISVGIELGDEKVTPRHEINLDLPETNLKDFLDSVIAKDPRYSWKLEGGVIHVWPGSDRDSLLAALLDTKVSPFTIPDGASRYGIYNDVMNLPEIKTKMMVAGVEHLVFRGPGSWGKIEKGAMFNDPGLTLRELLDKIVLRTEIKQWVILRWGKNSEYITLKSG